MVTLKWHSMSCSTLTHSSSRLSRVELRWEEEGGLQQRVLDGWKEPVPGHRLLGGWIFVCCHVDGYAHCVCQVQVP